MCCIDIFSMFLAVLVHMMNAYNLTSVHFEFGSQYIHRIVEDSAITHALDDECVEKA